MKSWKTTLFGALAAACSAVATDSSVSPTVKTIAGLGASVFMFLLGLAAKDSNVTGGTVQQ